ncbi:MAG: tetratricopeptide repeat protein [Zhengella sp.]|uniref:tetratricopeptide repeat protein n=1 Tax=Zhengella sp. TaxID=2282762 RepID=UPI001D4D8669|nr:tetratricopeptide repeat protein [Notoacmeibacter sp.]MCC0025600.1 tetratricopeptide repeat protein [Brucellaceae bacterium]
MNSKRRPSRFRLASLATTSMLVLALGISGCASKRLTTGSVGPRTSKPIEQMNERELGAASAGFGKAYAGDPKNKQTAMAYAKVLMMTNRTDQALAVMRKTAIYHPNDRDVLAAYGKSLAAAGQLEPALDAVRRAQTPEYPDWRLVSAEAAILDQLGQADAARALYQKALTLQPNEPSILSNLGMSHVLSGDLTTAETYMRQAATAPGADSRVRQNLALVVGLQGRFQEAEQIAAQELDPEQARANVAYLRSILAQQNSWAKLSDKDKKTN